MYQLLEVFQSISIFENGNVAKLNFTNITYQNKGLDVINYSYIMKENNYIMKENNILTHSNLINLLPAK